MNIREQLKGTGAAIVTPFNQDETVDFAALEKLINFIIGNGVEYIVTLGTTGETPTLDKQEKLDIINFTFEKINGRVPVVVGIGGNNTREVVEQVQSYPLDKAVAVLSACPYYNKPSQEGIFQHYKAIAEASPKPIILYNVPGRTGRNMEASTTLRLAHEVANVAGIKEAGNNISQCIQILKDRPADFLVVSGDDDLVLPELACGIDGVISVAANCYPKQFSDMVRAGLASDFAAAKKLNDPLLEVYNLLFTENNPAGVKGFLFEMGYIKNVVRLPVTPLSEGIQQKVKAYCARG
ncbi:MAG: dihydrodipicolinate synthase [Ferruginibacter sp.]|uniref:4-hydroxy-tetrahydrodipicolinate synthase n=1 Tax=Ferruginibacter sp. TaxID=1940288 RepID=UPI0026584E57|nr:4-hydroxy-tetrahydrodipicolinate synthase [Ferruginibacter sp.]MDB5276290.1 dihydrodipicolinate synthase [Ferruginibacter sp.]